MCSMDSGDDLRSYILDQLKFMEEFEWDDQRGENCSNLNGILPM